MQGQTLQALAGGGQSRARTSALHRWIHGTGREIRGLRGCPNMEESVWLGEKSTLHGRLRLACIWYWCRLDRGRE